MLFQDEVLAAIECILFVAGEPLTLERIAQIVDISCEDAAELIATLAQQYETERRGVQLVEVAGGYQLCTKPHLSIYIERLYKPQFQSLSQAALETLAIISYKQPVTRGEIELIRGVQSDRAVATLLEKNLIKELGRKDSPGRPVLFGTTDQFLQHFGLKNLEDLPAAEEVILDRSDEPEL